jgi:hypothetical protein
MSTLFPLTAVVGALDVSGMAAALMLKEDDSELNPTTLRAATLNA